MTKKFLIVSLIAYLCQACQPITDTSKMGDNHPQTSFENVPEWSKEVIWYQIFVERFRNGDPSNDPKAEDIVGNYSSYIPTNWEVTPWTQAWYKPDDYFDELHGKNTLAGYPITNFTGKIQLRRYGGDLQGVLDKIDYLEELGITAIYFNPLNDAPSLHKYDPRHWRHIDRNFGPDPIGDKDIIAQETPIDPTTWQFTHADTLFLKVIQELHKRGIRVIMDYSWNHTGKYFWALKDVRKNGENSPFVDWYDIFSYDDPQTTENEFEYKSWSGVPSLPEIKENVTHDNAEGVEAYDGDLYSETVRTHIFNVTKRWLDPNGDGDPSDGVDGFRLDVAGEIGVDFWKAYREEVRAVNPDAYLVGEIWWKKWPDKLLDPQPYLMGDMFDAVMNYRWYRAARHFFNQSPQKVAVSEFVDSLQAFMDDVRLQNSYAMMNLTASHDVPRFSTSIYNKNKYKVGANPNEKNDYKINKPDEETYQIMRLILAQQFTYIGSPHIWAGDEMGMWGGDDPNCRKPLIWKDYEFEAEAYHPIEGKNRPTDEVRFNEELFQYYQKLINIRKENPVLSHGKLDYLLIDDGQEVLAYSRFDDTKEVIVLFNTSDQTQQIEVPTKFGGEYADLLNGANIEKGEGSISILLNERSAAILK